MKTMVKRILVILTVCLLLISLGAISVSAAKIEWKDKIPLDTPCFQPTIDGQRDAGYSKEYTVRNQLQNHKIHEGGSRLSTAWFDNTLYFYVWVPDATASETSSCLYYQVDNVWFLLYFGTEADSTVKWSHNEAVKAFRILPFANVMNFKGQVNDKAAFAPRSSDFEWKVSVEEKVGYAIEVAYTVPQDVAVLKSGFECAFDMEVLDVCDGGQRSLDYRYILGESREENDLENFPYAYGAKLILGAATGSTATKPTATTTTTSQTTAGTTASTVGSTAPATSTESTNTTNTTEATNSQPTVGSTTSASQPEADTAAGGTVGALVISGIIVGVACVAAAVAAILFKEKRGKLILAAIALVLAVAAALLIIFGCLGAAPANVPDTSTPSTSSTAADTTATESGDSTEGTTVGTDNNTTAGVTTVTTTVVQTTVPPTSATTAGTTVNNGQTGDTGPVKHAYLIDPFFKKGMTYSSNTIGGAILGSLNYSNNTAAWDFGQLGSKYELISDGTYTQIADGVHQYEDQSKLLYIDTNTGEFKMGIKGSREYDRPRQGNEVFPGTLITTDEMTKTILLPELASVEVTLDFTLDYVINRMSDDEFNDGLHTAQWNYYAFISDSKSNEWFYVGLPLYDYRHEAGDCYGTDPGTGAFSYIPSYDLAFDDARVKVGERFTQTVDILPFIKIAFETAQQYGYLRGCSFENMYISGCNYGWELPGTFDCMATSHAFNMTYTLVEDEQ